MVRLEVRDPVVANVDRKYLVDIPYKDIADLVAELGLPKEAASQLSFSAWALTCWVNTPRILLQGSEDRSASRQRLAKIAKEAASLSAELEGLGLLSAMVLTEVGQDLPVGHCPPFNVIGLRLQFERLAQAAEEARNRLHPRKRGSQANGIAVIVTRQLVRVTERATGEPVRTSKTKNSVYDPHLPCRGGAFITAWFNRVDRYIGPTALRRMVLTSQKRLTEPGVAEEDAKSLEMCELALLSIAAPRR